MARKSSSTIRFKQDRTIDTKAEYFIVISIISFMIFIISICLISSIINDKDIPLFILFIIILGGLIWLLAKLIIDYKNKY